MAVGIYNNPAQLCLARNKEIVPTNKPAAITIKAMAAKVLFAVLMPTSEKIASMPHKRCSNNKWHKY
jgi:hypothetical protein